MYDCDDLSDEKDCKTIFFYIGNAAAYTTDFPPQVTGTVNVSATALSVMEVKELDGYWKCKVNFELAWFENRFALQNLRPNMIDNAFTQEERKVLWYPAVEFENTEDNSRMVVDEKAIVVEKQLTQKDQTDCCKNLRNSDIYYGERNPIVYQRIFTTPFLCEFDLRNFPFDTQQCTMELKVAESEDSYVELFPAEFELSGSRELNQFDIVGISKQNPDGKSVFIITLRRKFSYHLFSVYIPSLCLLAISLATMFISIDHFDNNVMIQITTMLVMYTLFQAISISLPQTAYVKLLDIWLLFGLILPFVSFVLNIIEQISRDNVAPMEEIIKVV